MSLKTLVVGMWGLFWVGLYMNSFREGSRVRVKVWPEELRDVN